jgi:Putative prokaryotic signal transducing protein
MTVGRKVQQVGNKREPSRQKPGKQPLVHLTTAPNEVVAQMWAEILEEDGIRCSTKMGTVAGDFLSVFTRMGVPVEIYVLASEAQRANRILDSLGESPADSD